MTFSFILNLLSTSLFLTFYYSFYLLIKLSVFSLSFCHHRLVFILVLVDENNTDGYLFNLAFSALWNGLDKAPLHTVNDPVIELHRILLFWQRSEEDFRYMDMFMNHKYHV